MPNLSSLESLKAALLKAVAAYDRIGIITHKYPDGDGLASAFALQELIKKDFKSNYPEPRNTDIILEEEPPAAFDYLQAKERVVTIDSCESRYDLIIVLDCHTVERVGKCAFLLEGAKQIIVIDHHEFSRSENAIATPYLHIDISHVSTGSIIFEMFRDNIVKLTDSAKGYILNSLYVTILNDTNIFTNSNTDSKAMHASAEMLSMGVKAGEIVKKYIPKKSPQYFRFIGQTLSTIKTYREGQVLFFHSTLEMMEDNGIAPEATAKMTENLKGLSDKVKVIVYARQIRADKYKLSLRSDTIDVNRIASALGGGGHKKAAGSEVLGSVIEIEDKVLALVDEQM